MYTERIAFDAASQRTKDKNGYLRVAVSHITKEAVNPYYGRDIPGAEVKGLDPNKIYMGYREGAALQRAAPSFNGLPLLLGHYEESAEAPQKEHRVGSLGTNAVYNAPYLDNSLIVTDSKAIEAIESGKAREISAAYRYDPVWEPGEYNGQHYDFIMRNIEGNHVALVREGRAGHDVIVADEKPDFMKGRDAMEGNRNPLESILAAVKAAKAGKDTDAVVEKYFHGLDGEALDTVKAIVEVAAEKPAEDEEDDMDTRKIMKQQGLAADDEEAVKAFDAGREYAKQKFAPVEDEDDEDVNLNEDDDIDVDAEGEDEEEFKPGPVEEDDDDIDIDDEEEPAEDDDDGLKDNPAFKAGFKYEKMKAKKKAFDDVETEKRIAQDAQIKTIAKVRKLYKAAEAVAPVIGRIKDPLAFDSAGDIYRKALNACGVSTKGVHPSAFPAMLNLAKRARAVSHSSPRRASFAMDSKDSALNEILAGLDSIRKAD